MDGAFTAVGAEGNRHLPTGYRLGMLAGSSSAGTGGSSASAGLFEQILSLPSSTSKHTSQRDQLTKPAGAEVASYASRTEASGEAQQSARSQPDNESSNYEDDEEKDAATTGNPIPTPNANTVTNTTEESLLATEASTAKLPNTADGGSEAESSSHRAVPIDGESLADGDGQEEVAPQLQLNPLADPTDNGKPVGNETDPTQTMKLGADTPSTTATVAPAEQHSSAGNNLDGQSHPTQVAPVEADLHAGKHGTPTETLAKPTSPLEANQSFAQGEGEAPQRGQGRGQQRGKWYETHNKASTAAQEPRAAEANSPVPSSVTEDQQDARADNLADPHQSLTVDSTSVEFTSAPIDLAIASPFAGDVAEALPQSPGAHSGNALQANEAGALESRSLSESFEPQNPIAKIERQESPGGASASQDSDQLTQAERVRLVQRVARSFARLGPMGGQINIRLHPPQLGSLNVQVRMEGRTMTAKLTTESTAARDAILESLPVLRGRLSEQGFEIASFQVEVADNHADTTSGQFQSGTDHADGGDWQRGGQVDYRRVSAMHRQTLQPPTAYTAPAAASELDMPSRLSIDVQA